MKILKVNDKSEKIIQEFIQETIQINDIDLDVVKNASYLKKMKISLEFYHLKNFRKSD